MYRITTGSLMHVYGAFGAKVHYTARLTVRLTDPVDAGILQRALDRTQERYPYFCVTLKKGMDEQGGREIFCYEENPRPVALLHRDEKVCLNTEDTNYHVWAVCYNEDRIHLDFFHGITDGTGMYKVLATLLYYYCVERYGIAKQEGIGLAGDIISPEETADPQDTIESPEELGSKIPAISFLPAFTAETDGGLTPSEATILDVEIPEQAFIRFTSSHDASPGTMVSILLARALDELYPERDKDIINAYVINARPMVNARKTYHNCLGMAVLSYDRIKGMPITKQSTIYRGMTFRQSYDEVVKNSVAGSAEASRKAAAEAESVDALKEVFGGMFNGGEGFFSFLVSYTGKWPYPELGQYILEFWAHPPNTFSLMAEIGAAGDKIFLSIQQRFREDCVREAFLRQLDKHGIPYKVDRVLKTDVASFDEPQ